MSLDLIQTDFLKKGRIPQGKIIQPLCNRRIFIHFGKKYVLAFIFRPFSAEQPFITGIGLRGVFEHCPIDRYRKAFTVPDLSAGR